MKLKFLALVLAFPLFGIAQTENNKTKKWNIGAHFVYRSMNAYEFYDDYSYPASAPNTALPTVHQLNLQ